jgi:Ca2+-transporting ATPase
MPAIALGVDPVSYDLMKQKPRNPKEHIINKNMASSILLLGVLIAAACLYIFNYGLQFGDARARTLVLTLLVCLEISQIILIRGKYHTAFLSNKWLWLAIFSSIGLQLAIIYTPLNAIFKMVPLMGMDWIYIICLASGVYIIGELINIIIIKITRQKY